MPQRHPTAPIRLSGESEIDHFEPLRTFDLSQVSRQDPGRRDSWAVEHAGGCRFTEKTDAMRKDGSPGRSREPSPPTERVSPPSSTGWRSKIGRGNSSFPSQGEATPSCSPSTGCPSRPLACRSLACSKPSGVPMRPTRRTAACEIRFDRWIQIYSTYLNNDPGSISDEGIDRVDNAGFLLRRPTRAILGNSLAVNEEIAKDQGIQPEEAMDFKASSGVKQRSVPRRR